MWIVRPNRPVQGRDAFRRRLRRQQATGVGIPPTEPWENPACLADEPEGGSQRMELTIC